MKRLALFLCLSAAAASCQVVGNLNDTTPAAPSGGVNVHFQKDTSIPPNASAYVPSGSFLNYGLLSTKGDLLGFSTVPARLAVGADGSCVVADSTQALGLRWSGGCAFTAAGDLSGSSSSQTVIGVRGLTLPTLAASTGFFFDNNGTLALRTLLSGDIPNNAANTSGNAGTASAIATNGSANQVWGMNSSATAQGWQTISGTFAAGGDLAGSSSAQVVVGVRGIVLPTLAASTGFLYDNNGVLQLNAAVTESQVTSLVADLAAKVSTATTVNGHSLSGNIVISAGDITTGTLPHAQLPTLLSGDIPNNAANTSGNAGTATALAALPSQCTGSQFATGVAANGNANCGTPAGSGNTTSTTMTPGVIPKASGANAIVNSLLDDGVTTAGTLTYQGNAQFGTGSKGKLGIGSVTWSAVDSGIADAYALDAVVASYVALGTGELCFLPLHSNATTTPTVNVNALGTKTIVKSGGSAVAASDIVASHVACLAYNGATMDLLDPQTAAAGGVISVNTMTGAINLPDQNTSGQVVSTHLTAPLPVNQGGTGTTSPGIVAGAGISVTGSWPNQTVTNTAGGGSTGTAAYQQSFSGVTGVTIPASSHGFATKALFAMCFDNSSPARNIPCEYTVDASTFQVVVSLGDIALSGYVVVGSGGPAQYVATESSAATWTVNASTHGLGKYVTAAAYDANGVRLLAATAVDSSGNVTVNFGLDAVAGKLVITQ
jgi:hypothetical protein